MKELKENYQQKDLESLCTSTVDNLARIYELWLTEILENRLYTEKGGNSGKTSRGSVIDVTPE